MMDHAVINDRVSSTLPTGTRLNDLPTDARLPQLPIILDVERMRGMFQDYLFLSISDQTDCVIRQCEIIQIRYKPASSCMVSYRLDIENGTTGDRGEQIVCGRAFPAGRSQTQWDKAGTRPLVQPRFGKPLLHLPEIEMVLWSFPNDRKIHALPAATGGVHRIPDFLPGWLASHRGPEWQIAQTTSDLVHYVGEHTCTVKTSVELVHAVQHKHQTMTIFGKTYYDEEGAQTDRVMQDLWDSASRRSGQIRIAEPMWYDAQQNTLWQLGIDGATLEDCAIENQESTVLFTEAAQAIAAFHATPLRQLRLITIPHLIDKLRVVGSMLTQYRPACRAVLEPVIARLTAQAESIPTNPTATLHGDLHVKNLFLTEGRIAIIDLDNVCEGPPAWDIGSFAAGLLAGAVTTPASLRRIAGHLQIFLEHYNQRSPSAVDMSAVAWCTAVALVIERSHRCVTRLKAGRRGQIEALLNLADRISETLSLEPPADGWTNAHERSKSS
jgi:Phosphotransferase enzyme family